MPCGWGKGVDVIWTNPGYASEMIRTLFIGMALATQVVQAQLPSVETATAVRQPIVQQVKVTGTITSPRAAT